MNASKTTSLIRCAMLVLGFTSVQAQEGDKPVPELSRAEVLAEVEIWRESGLADAQSGESASDPVSNTYVAALARYEALRKAPSFALIVQRIARERGETVKVAGQA